MTTSNEDLGSAGRPDNDSHDKIKREIISGDLFLLGAIVQLLELDNPDDDALEIEEDWEGGHSITLLKTSNTDESLSWLLIDDDTVQPISEERAIKIIGGTVESNYDARDNKINNNINKNDPDETDTLTCFAASLLVYSVPEAENGLNDDWKPLQDDIVSLWTERKAQLMSIVASEQALVGRRIRVKWAKGKFYPGAITRYDPSTGKHRVTYDDGDVKDYNLAQKTIEWID